MNQLSALGGVVRYEFVMQVRRVAFWIVFGLLAVIPLIQFTTTQNYTHDNNIAGTLTHANITVVEMAGAASILIVGAGLLLAGRYWRDRTTRVDEVLRTTPATILSRLLGKFAGNVLAALVPVALIYTAGIALLAAQWHDVSIVPLAIAGFVAFAVPAILFVSAFSIACTTVLWPPLYMFLFIGYVLWDSLDPKGPIPTLDGGVLSPSERLVMTGIFHFTPFRTADLTYYPHASIWLGVANIAALLAAGALALFVAWRWLEWRANHE